MYVFKQLKHSKMKQSKRVLTVRQISLILLKQKESLNIVRFQNTMSILIQENKLKSLKVAQVKDEMGDDEDDGCECVSDVAWWCYDVVMWCFFVM